MACGAMCAALRTPRRVRMHEMSTRRVFGALRDVPRDPSTVQ